jgi:hypothetical protein
MKVVIVWAQPWPMYQGSDTQHARLNSCWLEARSTVVGCQCCIMVRPPIALTRWHIVPGRWSACTAWLPPAAVRGATVCTSWLW